MAEILPFRYHRVHYSDGILTLLKINHYIVRGRYNESSAFIREKCITLSVSSRSINRIQILCVSFASTVQAHSVLSLDSCAVLSDSVPLAF